MSNAKMGTKVPDFQLPATGNQTIRLTDLKGSNVVLYFYPKDNTPGCTTEGQDFRANHAKFQRLGTVVLGVSRDSVRSHEGFKEKEDFPFELLSDADEGLCNTFGVMKDKVMYGKPARGVSRSTFLIDREGKLRREWRDVKVPGHVEEVLAAVKELEQG